MLVGENSQKHLNLARGSVPICRTFEGVLEATGWTVVSTTVRSMEDLAAELTALALSLGEIAPGRGGLLIEPVVPETSETARAGSLSSYFGLSPLPLHNDTAHWNVPCRYLALACVEPGPTPTPTILLDTRTVRLSKSEELACRSAVFAIRNGRHSFYASIMERDRQFIRLDPGCMIPLSGDGAAALAAFTTDRHAPSLHRHDWKRGDILVLDNWRMLHARGYKMPTERGRILIRVMVR